MAQFTVTWTIEVEADTAREAAETALNIQRNYQSTATYFEVKEDKTGEETHIDLAEEETEEKEKVDKTIIIAKIAFSDDEDEIKELIELEADFVLLGDKLHEFTIDDDGKYGEVDINKEYCILSTVKTKTVETHFYQTYRK